MAEPNGSWAGVPSMGGHVRERLASALPAYELGEEIGRGACGVVIAAEHARLGRRVAIKLLDPGPGVGADVAARFITEAQVLASLDHPNIVTVYDFVEREGACFLVLERLTGGSVQERLQSVGFSPQEACAVVVAACAGLGEAHRHGVLHRDVKPQNLLLSAEGTVKVADFGIAKLLAQGGGARTRTGMLLGSPAYMAPEQVTGGALSAATDVYGAGVVLYELLCGSLPFAATGDVVADLRQRVDGQPTALRERAPHLPSMVAAITDRALQREPAARFASVGDLGAALADAAREAWGADWAAAGAAVEPPAPRSAAEATVIEAPIASPGRRVDEPILERERELATLGSALREAVRGSGRLVIIEGPAGIGKTRLLERARSLAGELGFTRVGATGYDTERTLAWGVLRQLVDRSLARASSAERQKALAGGAGRALQILDQAPGDAGGDDASLAPAMHALWWVAADVAARRPLLMAIDDVQWADHASLRFLAYLARRMEDLPIAMVLTSRPLDAGVAALDELVTLPAVRHLAPQPLSDTAVRDLTGARVHEEVVHALREVGEGNPFLLRQLLGELCAQGEALEDARTVQVVRRLGPAAVARTRMSRLSEDALTVARVFAVAGERDGPEMCRTLGVEAVARAADELLAADVLAAATVSTAADGLVFAHPVIREAVLSSMGWGQRSRLHADVARALVARAASAERVAAHLFLAPPGTLPDAAAWLCEAARPLLATGDVDGAVGYLRRAHAEAPGDHDVAADLGEALLRDGQAAEAHRLLRDAARATTADLQRAARLAAAASARLVLDGTPAAASELRDALETETDHGARLHLEAALGGICSFDAEEFRRCTERLIGHVDLPGDSHDERLILAFLARSALARVRPAGEVAALAQRALGDGAWITEGAAGFAAFGGALVALVMADDLATARRNLQVAQQRVREGSPRDFVLHTACQALVSWRAGDVDATAAEASAAIGALELADRDPAVAGMHAVATRLLVLALVEAGDLPQARRALGDFDAAVAEPPTTPHHYVRLARAALALAEDDPVRAREEAEALGAVARSAGAGTPSVPWRSYAALAAHGLGDGSAAQALAAEQLELARRWGAASDVGGALRVVARVQPHQRMDRLREAVDVLERSPARLELAHAMGDLGTQLLVQGDEEARRWLRRCAQLASDCGGYALRERAHAALLELGEQPLAVAPVLTLTPAERRVAELAAAGLSDRDIARELFVTPRKVESHLRRVFDKLGIPGRRQLAGALTLV